MLKLARLALPVAVALVFAACSSDDDGAGGTGGSGGSGGSLPEGGAGEAGASGADASQEDSAQAEAEADAPIDGLPVTLDTFNLYLAGSFAPLESERRPMLLDAISKMPSDIVCIQEAWRDSDKKAIIEAAKATFPYAVSFETDLSTPVDDPTMADGGTPEPQTEAPCAGPSSVDGGPTLQEMLTATMDCVVKNCSTIPGSDQGKTTSTSCAATACLNSAAGLVLGGPAERRCYGCAASMMPDAKLADIRDECMNNPKAGLAFDGQNSLVLLSKHPLKSAEMRVIPGTWNRRIFMYAQAELPEGKKLDVYCNHLSAVFYDVTFPYTGDYGNGASDYKGWEAEQLLQIQKLSKYVSDKSGTSPAVVLGDFNAGPADKAHAIEADGEAAYNALLALWPEAVPASFEPFCTFCTKGGNTLASGSPNSFIDHVFLSNIDKSAVLSAERTFDDPVVPVPVGQDGGVSIDGGPAMVHLSDHYGMRSVIVLKD